MAAAPPTGGAIVGVVALAAGVTAASAVQPEKGEEHTREGKRLARSQQQPLTAVLLSAVC